MLIIDVYCAGGADYKTTIFTITAAVIHGIIPAVHGLVSGIEVLIAAR